MKSKELQRILNKHKPAEEESLYDQIEQLIKKWEENIEVCKYKHFMAESNTEEKQIQAIIDLQKEFVIDLNELF